MLSISSSMHIVLCTDNRYVMPTGVLMQSIGQNNPASVHYHILVDEDFASDSREALADVARKFGGECSFYVISRSFTADLPFGKDGMPAHVSLATYYRLFLADVLPPDLHKVLYLDGDMIVRHSLQPLWDEPLDGYAIAAVPDMSAPNNAKRLGINDYFNAGTLLVNLDYWREHRSLDLFGDFLRMRGNEVVLHDQDVLNVVFANVVKRLPVTYNFQNGFILSHTHKQYNPSLQSEIDVCKTDPTIIHYTVYCKPWNIACFHPYRDEWRKYQRQTQWKDFRYEEPKPLKLIHYVRNWLFRHTSYVPMYDRMEYEKGLILAEN
ncbi:MAG: glycosyltransferase family 8 protein [Bacteroidales bacterium]|nr:glycosyltransferase family 8 protein [Bacteroidales bacterium]